MKSVIYY